MSASAAAFLLLGGCGIGRADDQADTADLASAATAPAPECAADEAALPEASTGPADRSDCERDAFLNVVHTEKLGDLAELQPDEAVAYGRGVCVFAEAVARGQITPAPSVDELVTSTAKSWGVDEGVVRDVIAAYGSLCPDHADVFGQEVR